MTKCLLLHDGLLDLHRHRPLYSPPWDLVSHHKILGHTKPELTFCRIFLDEFKEECLGTFTSVWEHDYSKCRLDANCKFLERYWSLIKPTIPLLCWIMLCTKKKKKKKKFNNIFHNNFYSFPSVPPMTSLIIFNRCQFLVSVFLTHVT